MNEGTTITMYGETFALYRKKHLLLVSCWSGNIAHFDNIQLLLHCYIHEVYRVLCGEGSSEGRLGFMKMILNCWRLNNRCQVEHFGSCRIQRRSLNAQQSCATRGELTAHFQHWVQTQHGRLSGIKFTKWNNKPVKERDQIRQSQFLQHHIFCTLCCYWWKIIAHFIFYWTFLDTPFGSFTDSLSQVWDLIPFFSFSTTMSCFIQLTGWSCEVSQAAGWVFTQESQLPSLKEKLEQNEFDPES